MVLVPVPLAKQRFFERGFNQAEWLAEELGKIHQVRVISNGLKKVKDTDPQSTLSRLERQRNLENAFRWDPKVQIPQFICLVDDVLTTGETLNECRQVLIKAGASAVMGWTLFKTDFENNPEQLEHPNDQHRID